MIGLLRTSILDLVVILLSLRWDPMELRAEDLVILQDLHVNIPTLLYMYVLDIQFTKSVNVHMNLTASRG